MSCSAALAALSMAAAAGAQESSAPVMPAPASPAGRVAGPPDGIIPPPPVTPAPAPILLPQPDNRPSPILDARAEPPPQRTPSPAPAATPVTRQAQSSPGAATPAPVAPDTPVASDPVDIPAPTVDVTTPSDVVNLDAPPLETTTVDQDVTPGAPWWQSWPAIAAALLALFGAIWLFLRRQRPAPLALPPPDAIKSRPAPTPPGADRHTGPLPRAATGQRADLAFRLEPLSASSTLVNFRMRYAVIVTNTGAVDAQDCALRIGLFAGTQASERGVHQWLMLDDQSPHHHAPVIVAGGEHRFEGELAAPLDSLGAMELNGRKLAIALVALDLRYHHPAGKAVLDGQTARAFVVGREPGDGAARLAPFRIDQGPTSFAPLGVRDTRIGHVG